MALQALEIIKSVTGHKKSISSSSSPSKSPGCIRPKFRHWPAIDAPYKWPKFGALPFDSFSARQKKWVERMPGINMQIFLKSEYDDTPHTIAGITDAFENVA